MRKLGLILPVLFLMVACSSDGDRRFVKSPIDNLVRDLDAEKNFSIILFDMDMKDETFSSDEFRHKYKIITMKDSLPQEKITDWVTVDEATFMENENNMGMEIASKVDGKLSKVAAPPGYSQYVGNSRYGQWTTGSNGTSFWEFYGQYAMMSSMLGLAGSMINRNQYYDYRDNYLGRSPYYGKLPDGRPAYGTYSAHGERANPDFYKRTGGTSAFKSRVSDRVTRSSSSGRGSSSSSSSSGSSWSSKKSSGSSSGSSSSRRSFGGGGRRRR